MNEKLAGNRGPCPEYTLLEETDTGRSPKRVLHTLPYIGENYFVSFDFKPTAPITGVRSVVHLTKEGTGLGDPGYRIPEVWFGQDSAKKQFYIATAIGDNPNNLYISGKEF